MCFGQNNIEFLLVARYNKKNLAPSSSGQDTGFSILQQGFNSPWGCTLFDTFGSLL